MKKVVLIFLFLAILPVFAQNQNFICPVESINIIEGETLLNKITGVSFISRKTAEKIIQKEINDELENSKVLAELEIFNLKRLKQGEFKSLNLKTDLLKYRALSLSDFNAQTVCPFNKFIYKNRKIYFPLDIPFKFEGKITNNDIKNIINSKEFQKEIKKINIIGTPSVIIKDGYLYFKVPVKALVSFDIKFKANIEVENNKILLRNITFNSKSNIINNDILSPIINKINPIAYETNNTGRKYFRLNIIKAVIVDDVIKTNGVLVIKKNYSEDNE